MADSPEEQIKVAVDQALGPIKDDIRTLNHRIDGLAWAYEVFVMNALRASTNPRRFARDLLLQIDAEQARPDMLKQNRPDAPEVPAVYRQSLGRLREIVCYFTELMDSGERKEEAHDVTLSWWGGGPSWQSFECADRDKRRDAIKLVRSKDSDRESDD